jgi:CheY-like chemotaxis protein
MFKLAHTLAPIADNVRPMKMNRSNVAINRASHGWPLSSCPDGMREHKRKAARRPKFDRCGHRPVVQTNRMVASRSRRFAGSPKSHLEAAHRLMGNQRRSSSVFSLAKLWLLKAAYIRRPLSKPRAPTQQSLTVPHRSGGVLINRVAEGTSLSSCALYGMAPRTSHRILVVDDEPWIRLDVAESLREAGYEAVEVSSADQAMEVLDRETFALILTDIDMPGRCNGLDLAWAAHQRDPTLPVVLMSGRVLPPPRGDAAPVKPSRQAFPGGDVATHCG